MVSAYRESAKRLHPDRGGDKESFQRLQSAYSQALVPTLSPTTHPYPQLAGGHGTLTPTTHPYPQLAGGHGLVRVRVR